MPDFDRILTAYEHRLRQVVDELVAESDPSPEDRAHLLFVTQLLQAIIRTYDRCQMGQTSALDASTSVMYAASTHEGRKVLNVPLRSLVDSGTLSAPQARFINGVLGLRRSVLVSGGTNVGKSTLLNALIGLLPANLRLASISDGVSELPALRGRSFVVQLAAKVGSPEWDSAFIRAGRMRPDWIVVGELRAADVPRFLEGLSDEVGGLATLALSDPARPLSEWLGLDGRDSERLAELNPLILHLERDKTGRPRITRVLDAVLKQAPIPNPLEAEPRRASGEALS